MAKFTNGSNAALNVGGQVVAPGESLDLDGDKLPGSLRLIQKGLTGGGEREAPRRAAEPAKDGDKAPAGGGGAKDADKAPAGGAGGAAGGAGGKS